MSKITLKKLIYKNYLKTALTSILFIEIMLVFLYFSSNKRVVNSTVDFALNDLKLSVLDRVNSTTSIINEKFNNLENQAILLQNEHQNFFLYKDNITLDNKPKFSFAPNGMYYKTENNGGSSVVVSKNTTIDKNLKDKLTKTEIFDKNFKSIVSNNKIVEAVYFNSYDDICRYYPFLEDSFNVFPSDIKMENYNFYYEADKKHNPKKEPVWTDVYLDPAGKGWMISLIAPIYKNDFLEGVTGIDVTLSTIIDTLLSLKLPFNGSSMILNKDGDIVVMGERMEGFLQIKENYTYDYKNQKIEKTVLKNDKSNILNYKDKIFVKVLKNVIGNKSYPHEITLNEKKYMLFIEKIEITDWFLISLIPEENIISEVKKLEEQNLYLGYFIIGFIIVFYILFFIYLYKKAKNFVETINNPLLKIVYFTKFLGSKKNIKQLEHCGIEEIDSLNDNFNNLAQELDKRTKRLIQSENKRKENEKLANTDQLTKVYNRRFLEDFSNRYMKIVKREHNTLSLLLIDIDDFKTVNDTYGHDVGDRVIKLLVKRLKTSVRDNDIIVRLGGDEFLVLLPSTPLENAKKVGKKILDVVNSLNEFENDELRFTITIGSSEYKKSDLHINEMINRADNALYKAKKLGKNQVI